MVLLIIPVGDVMRIKGEVLFSINNSYTPDLTCGGLLEYYLLEDE